MSEPVNLFAPQVRKDPYPTYARMRMGAPIQQIEPGGFWAVSRHEDVEAVLKNTQVFSSTAFAGFFRPDWLPHNPIADSIVCLDGLDHARLRSLLSRAFTPRAIARMEPRIREIVADLCDGMARLGDLDFVSDFCGPLPGRVVAELLGIEPALHREFRRWVGHLAAVSPLYPGDEMASAIRANVAEMEGYFRDVVAARRKAPQDDMVSDLVRAEIDGAALTDRDIVSFLFILLPAGFETTMHLFATMMLRWAAQPETFARLRADRALIPAYVEESLRIEPPVHGVMRITMAETEVGGVKVPPGAMVLVLLGSANHDEAKIPSPERFDPSRKHAGLAFGHGPHFCLGAPLARLEARVAVEELTARFRGFERLPGEIEWNVAFHVRGPTALPIRVLLPDAPSAVAAAPTSSRNPLTATGRLRALAAQLGGSSP